MRQAGRYMAEYRALRQRYSLLQICAEPELATAVTMQPVDLIDVDAAILFSDLLLPFTPMGLAFDFVKGEGPAIDHPVRSATDVDRVRPFEPREKLTHVLATIRMLRQELAGKVPLIGFGGAPFTMSAYAIEGGPSTSYATTKAFMYEQPQAWHTLCDRFATMMADYLRAQIEAGVQAIQVFDSWVGQLSRTDYREFALPHSKKIFDALKDTGVPTLHFGVGTGALLADMREAGGDVLGVDWRQPLDEAWAGIGHDRGIQGNLDPTLLLAPRDRLMASADDVLRRAGGRPGHIFNLGHGILPQTNIEHVQALATHVHEYKQTV
jgi:uroporphyrinogen decarboxylase